MRECAGYIGGEEWSPLRAPGEDRGRGLMWGEERGRRVTVIYVVPVFAPAARQKSTRINLHRLARYARVFFSLCEVDSTSLRRGCT